jgi:hypothetical protein
MTEMKKEKDLKEKGETLAKVAVEGGLGSKQLTTLYKLAKTKPVPFIEVFVKRQMGRNVEGFNSFGPPMLELLSECANDKASLQKTLMYANMLYPYFEKQATMGIKEEIEPIVKQIVEGFGYRGLEISERRGITEFSVNLARFRGDPAMLASKIRREIGEKAPRVSKLRFRVWIDRT